LLAIPSCMFSFFKKKPPTPTPLDAAPVPPQAPTALPVAEPAAERSWLDKLRSGIGVAAPQPEPPIEAATPSAPVVPIESTEPLVVLEATPAERNSWMTKLRNGLRKTGSSIAQ